MELAFRRWKIRLVDHGFLLSADSERLTNTRYADDIMLYAKTADELENMLDLLIDELGQIDLHLNTNKTKIFTTEEEHPDYIDIRGDMVEILSQGAVHRYLGRILPGNLKQRGDIEVKNRLQNGWFRFHKERRTLTNKNVSIKLRLKLFGATVTPTILFGFAVLPLRQHSLEKIDIVQRKMLRIIFGWVRIEGESWQDTMHRMKNRVDRSLIQWPIKSWSSRIDEARWHHIDHLKKLPNSSLPMRASHWNPENINDPTLYHHPARNRGRPLSRWDDSVNLFCWQKFGTNWINAPNNDVWTNNRQEFLGRQ